MVIVKEQVEALLSDASKIANLILDYIKDEDVIVTVNDNPIITQFDLEMELYQAIKRSAAKVKIWRKDDDGYKEVQLNLEKTSDKRKDKIAKKPIQPNPNTGLYTISFRFK